MEILVLLFPSQIVLVCIEKLYTKYLVLNESHRAAMQKLRVPTKSYKDLDVNVLIFGIFLGVIVARFDYFFTKDSELENNR